ncbi:PLDc N-terminal domain-containing protein [Phocaeicola massiliensis]
MVRTKSTQGSRILYVLIVLLLPVIGISIYYLIRE